MTDIVERLRERRKIKYAANCKCGKCQCVHIDDVYQAADEIERLRSALGRGPSVLRALANAIEDIQWMSGAADFAPDGKAHKGWMKVRIRLARYEDALEQAVNKLPAWKDKP